MAKPDVVDLAQLDQYTGGDHVINREILLIFDSQCREMLAKLEQLAGEEADGQVWRDIVHTLKGAARGIGAFGLGDTAAEAEKAQTGNGTAISALLRLREDAAAVQAFIAEFLKSTP
jgi:HPt (histidine-containing phosphotransfer) domain-containing protein